MKDNLHDIVLGLAEPLVHDRGLEVWGLDISGAGPQTVRLFVDVPLNRKSAPDSQEPLSTPQSASIDQCEDISRSLGLALEVEDCFPGAWVLEVSSPGLERKFYSLAQMQSYVGDMVEAVLSVPLPGADSRKTYRGRLVSVGPDSFVLDPCSIGEDGRELPEGIPPVTIPWEQVRKASRIHLFTANVKPGKGSRKRNVKSS